MHWNYDENIEKALDEVESIIKKFKQGKTQKEKESFLFFLGSLIAFDRDIVEGRKKRSDIDELIEDFKKSVEKIPSKRLKEHQKIYERNLQISEEDAIRSSVKLEIIGLEIEKRRKSSGKLYGISKKTKEDALIPASIGLIVRAESEEDALAAFYKMNGHYYYSKDSEFCAVLINKEKD